MAIQQDFDVVSEVKIPTSELWAIIKHKYNQTNKNFNTFGSTREWKPRPLDCVEERVSWRLASEQAR